MLFCIVLAIEACMNGSISVNTGFENSLPKLFLDFRKAGVLDDFRFCFICSIYQASDYLISVLQSF